jgi:radical SAM protein with 4Fe4S-binding SPASM domain
MLAAHICRPYFHGRSCPMRLLKKRYYVSQEDAPLHSRLWRKTIHRQVPAFPKTVQIQTMTGCNAACIFCPYCETVDSQPKGRMSPSLFEQIIDEIARHPVRRISPYLMNEPLLDPGLFDKLAILRDRCPKARIVLTTNGSLLTPENRGKLIQSRALHAVYISFQGIEKEGYEATMRGSLVFEKSKARVDAFIDEWQRMPARERFKIVVTMVATNKIDVRKAVSYWQAKGVQSKWTRLENRGGNTLNAQLLCKNGLRPHTHCTRLFKQAYIMFNGDMVLCCTDYTRQVVLGNLADNSIEAIWNGTKAREIRALYSSGRSDLIPLCRECEIAGSDDEF